MTDRSPAGARTAHPAPTPAAIAAAGERIERILREVIRALGKHKLKASAVVLQLSYRDVDVYAAIALGRKRKLIVVVEGEETNRRRAQRRCGVLCLPEQSSRLEASDSAPVPLNPSPDTAVPAGQRSLREVRKAAGWTQATLAAAAGVTQPSLSRWESGNEPTPPDRDTNLRHIIASQRPPAPEAVAIAAPEPQPAPVAPFPAVEIISERKRTGLTQRQLAVLVGVRHDTVGRWEKGTRGARGRFADSLREIFAGLPDAPPEQPPLPGPELRRQRKAARLSQRQIAEAIGVDQALVSYWERTRGVPPRHRVAVRRALLDLQPPAAPPSGAELQRWREAAGWTKRRMATELDVHPITIGKWERGGPVRGSFVEPLRRLLATPPPERPAPQPPAPPLLPPAELLRLRHDAGWSQERLGRELKVSGASVCHWEHGVTRISDARAERARALLEAAAAERILLEAAAAERMRRAPAPDKIARLRRAAGWRQRELGERAGGVSNVDISLWERGHPVPPDLIAPLRSALAAALLEARRHPLPNGPAPTAEDIRRLCASYGWSRRVLAERLGVKEHTVVSWEQQGIRPRQRLWEQIRRLQDEAPPPAEKMTGDELLAGRIARGLTQRELGKLIGVTGHGTFPAWESGDTGISATWATKLRQVFAEVALAPPGPAEISGPELRRLRLEAKVSQAELGLLLDPPVSRSLIGAWENGTLPMPVKWREPMRAALAEPAPS